MIKYCLLFFNLLFTSLAFSQQEASVWYFGSNAGEFNNINKYMEWGKNLLGL